MKTVDERIDEILKAADENCMYNKNMEEQKQVKKLQRIMVSTIFIVIISLLLSPIISFVSGYLGGMILSATVGNTLVKGLNYIFNTDRFSKEMLPYLCGALATIGSYFRSIVRSGRE